MRLCADPITPGSYAVRIWLDAEPGKGWTYEPYDTICNINWLSQHECEIAPCLGVLSEQINIALGLKCLSLGFRVMHFSVPEGATVSHWAEYIKTVNGMDYYRVDLPKAAAQL